MEQTRFVDVLLPLAIPRTYTYRVPRGLESEVGVGKRVVVPFKTNKLYTGLIQDIHHKAPEAYEARYIDEVLDPMPIVNEKQFKLWKWISEYYICHTGEVMNAALPGGFKLTSETRLVLHPDFEGDYQQLNDKEFMLTEALELRNVLTVEEVAAILDQKRVYPVIRSMVEKRVVLVEEELKERFKPKTVAYVRLTEQASEEAALQMHFDRLEKAPRQLEILMSYVQLSRHFSSQREEVKKTVLQDSVGATSALVNQLVKKGIFEVYEREVGRIPETEASKKDLTLSDTQQLALNQIEGSFEQKQVTLLHGVTASGKTEIYVELIRKVLDEGKQVLFLLPEIALTTQLINRLRRYFGDRVGVFHSRFNQNEKVELWNQLLDVEKGRFDIILGARSSVFLPFSNLGLIIVDEEHEVSFKQFEPSPRYHARDTAVVLAAIHKAKVLLGSATPSVESYHNAKTGKYGLVELTKRYRGGQLPEIWVGDIREATRKREMKGIFTPLLYEQMKEVLERKQQIILFQNRRGFSPHVICEVCGWTPFCKNCDVGLTYHKAFRYLNCHYCGYSVSMPRECQACGSTRLKLNGFGTEKIEEELGLVLPEVRIARMDLDTTRSKNAYQNIIGEFEDQAIDILVGTQMVTKGLDFRHVGLVGVLNADQMLNFPDFRAFERAYQLMSQVAGRAGRTDQRGKVIIQTYNPNHVIIRQVMHHRYEEMFEQQLLERRNFHYPPYHRLIRVTVRHRDLDKVEHGAGFLAAELRTRFGTRILGPEFPYVKRVRNQYNKQVMIKIERKASLGKAKALLKEAMLEVETHPEHKAVRLIVDVDPY